MDYSGPQRTKAWVDDPKNDVRYVWSDDNEAEALSDSGRSPLYIDAHPDISTSWGGRVNDGFHRGAHLQAIRVPNTDRVIMQAIAPAEEGEELYMEYGPDYWQWHYFDGPT